MSKIPLDLNTVKNCITNSGLKDVGSASIREINRLVLNIEKETKIKYIRMEFGIPGLEPPQIEIEAEIAALNRKVGSVYPPFDGLPGLKKEISRFIKSFLNIEVDQYHCFPTVGSMQGGYMAMMMTARRDENRSKMLFIDPGFPAHKQQAKALGLDYEHFDVYNFRGDKLREKVEPYFQKGDIAAVIYSNPNNPSWICFTDKELQIIGELCTKYDVIAVEDLAYFGMDFRQDYSKPGEAPFIPSIANFTDNYILMISGSKSFSLAGQRISMTAISNNLFNSKSKTLIPYFETDQFGNAYIFGAMYAMCSGVTHSVQCGLQAILKATNNGEYDFCVPIREYATRAKVMKKLFTENGFKLVYDFDEDQPLADGFYFTVAFPGFSGNELVGELIYYGISAISLSITGSEKIEGIRACVSMTGSDRFDDLEIRLRKFQEDHQNGERIID
jgi:aspartate/methionine/tyrosine aminotransferase